MTQRVTRASVTVADDVVGRIGRGLMILLCAEDGDTDTEAEFFARKIAAMRIFAGADGRTNLSVRDVGGSALVISQFTLAAAWRKGNRPSFSKAAAADRGERLYTRFCRRLEAEGVPVETGHFGARMEVALVNDGPFTIWMSSREP